MRWSFHTFEPGTVWLVGAGPGAPGLLSLLGYHALQQADVVVYDALVSRQAAGARQPPRPNCVHAGKRGGKPSPKQADISLTLIELAQAGKRVLRLKGGDPFMFGRGGEEAGALARAGRPLPHRAGHFIRAGRARLCGHPGDASRHQPRGDLSDRARRNRRHAAIGRLGSGCQRGAGDRHVHGGQASWRHRRKC